MNSTLLDLRLVRLARALLYVLAAVLPIAALGAASPARGAESETHTGHGWFVLPPSTDGENTWAVFHVPPRRVDGANLGAVQLGTVLARRPTHLAGVRSRVYVVLQPERGPEVRQRRVLTMMAQPSVGGGWVMEPSDRLTAVDSLPADPDLVSFVGTPHGPAALLHTESAGEHARWDLKVYSNGRWMDVSLPEEIQRVDGPPTPGAAADSNTESSGGVWAVSYPWGVALLTLEYADAGGGEGGTPRPTLRLWTTVLPAIKEIKALKKEQTIETAWASSTLALPTGWSAADVRGADFVGVDGQVLALRRAAAAKAGEKEDERTLEVFLLRARESAHVASLEGVPSRATWRGMQGAGSSLSTLTPAQAEPEEQPAVGGGRLVVTWEVPPSELPGGGSGGSGGGSGGGGATLLPTPKNPAIQVREIALDGQVLYSGDARSTGPISKRDLQMLVSLLIVVMTCVVFFVLRDEKPKAVLPAGLTPCNVSRRVVAAMLDFLPAVLVASLVTGVSVSAALDPMAIVTGDYRTLLVAVLLAWAHTTLGEWLMGASIGKSMVGCGVISLSPLRKKPSRGAGEGGDAPTELVGPLRKPTLAQAVLRNAVKWVLPILGLAMLFDTLRRHPGDLLARTAVVMQEEEEDESE